jgi:hypothetical protein
MTFLKIIWFPIANVRQTSNAKLIIAPRPSLVGISYDHASIKLDDFHWNLFISGQGSTICAPGLASLQKKNSFEPDLNQRPMDYRFQCRHYSPPLYQLSYRRIWTPHDEQVKVCEHCVFTFEHEMRPTSLR